MARFEVDVDIMPGDSQNIEAHLVGKSASKSDFELETEKFGSEYIVKVIDEREVYCHNMKLEIKLPMTTFDTISVKETIGDITMDINATNDTFETESGDIRIR